MWRKTNSKLENYSYLLRVVFFVFLGLILLVTGCSSKKNQYIATINRIILHSDTTIFRFEDGKYIMPAGFHIPKNTPNYRPYMEENLKNLVIDKEALVTTIAKTKVLYPKFDIVEIEIDGVNINEKLVREGLAFFDHGYYPGHKKYASIEEEARKERKGIWQHEHQLFLFYVGSKRWHHYHFPECSKVKNISPKDKIHYYFEPPDTFMRLRDWLCKYCEPKAREIEKKKKEEHIEAKNKFRKRK